MLFLLNVLWFLEPLQTRVRDCANAKACGDAGARMNTCERQCANAHARRQFQPRTPCGRSSSNVLLFYPSSLQTLPLTRTTFVLRHANLLREEMAQRTIQHRRRQSWVLLTPRRSQQHSAPRANKNMSGLARRQTAHPPNLTREYCPRGWPRRPAAAPQRKPGPPS